MANEPRKNPPARAFKGSLESRIQAVIREVAVKLYRMAKPKFTGPELMKLFVPYEYHEPLRQAFQLARGGGMGHHLYVKLDSMSTADYDASGALVFEWYEATAPDAFFPIYAAGGDPTHPIHGPLDECPRDLRLKFTDTIRAMTTIAYEWGLVKRVFDELNQPNYCTTPQQMRFAWPSILQLLKLLDPPEDRLIASLQQESIRAGDRARVPLLIQPFIRSSYDVVTRSIFLAEQDPQDRVGTAIPYRLMSAKFKTKGITVDGLM